MPTLKKVYNKKWQSPLRKGGNKIIWWPEIKLLTTLYAHYTDASTRTPEAYLQFNNSRYANITLTLQADFVYILK